MEHRVVTDYASGGALSDSDSIKVYVRARPPEDGQDVPSEMWAFDENEQGRITIKDPARHLGEHAFLFNQIRWTETSQDEIFQEVSVPVLDHCMKGFNGCCFAYGQTGSGKTYSMFGGDGDQRGIIPRSVEYVFDCISKKNNVEVTVVVSFLEMYCGEIRDLGRAYLDKMENPGGSKKTNTSDWYMQKLRNVSSRPFIGSPLSSAQRNSSPANASGGQPTVPLMLDGYSGDELKIHEDSEGDVYVKDLTQIPVTSADEAMRVVKEGFKIRATHETKMNKQSSRSHTVYTINIIQKDTNSGETTSGILNLVDLAGSERLNKSESEGQRLREALSINASLSALGKVAMALGDDSSAFVPYRDSKLTRLLQSSLGGNSHTSVIAALHPTKNNYEECLNTLQFANRCRNVVNQPRINYVDKSKSMVGRVKRLQAEVRRLTMMIRVIIKRKNAQLGQLLTQLGVQGQVLNDGRVKLADGTIIGTKLDLATIEKEATEALQKGSEGDSPEEGNSLANILDANATADGEDEESGGVGGGTAGSGITSLTSNSMLGGGSTTAQRLAQLLANRDMKKLKAQLESEREECKQLRNKVDELKHKNRTITKSGDEERVRSAHESRRVRENTHSMQSEIQRMRREHEVKLSQLKEHFESEAQRISESNAQLQANHSNELTHLVSNRNANNVRNTNNGFGLDQSSKLNSLGGTSMERGGGWVDTPDKSGFMGTATLQMPERRLARQPEAYVEELIKGHKNQIESLKKQSAYWLDVKEQQMATFVEQFNEYHQVRSDQVNSLTAELELLHGFSNTLHNVLEGVQQGKYPIRSFGIIGLKPVCIPKSEKPDAGLLMDERRLPHLRRQIKNLKAFEMRQKQKLLAQLEDVDGRNFDNLENSTGEANEKDNRKKKANNITITNFSDLPPRPQSAFTSANAATSVPVTSRSSPGKQKQILRTDNTDYNVPLVASDLLHGVVFNGVELDLTDRELAQLSASELATHVHMLRAFVETDLREKLESNVVRDLESNQTVDYIAKIERELQNANSKLQAETEQHRSLRAAHQSQQRLFAKHVQQRKVKGGNISNSNSKHHNRHHNRESRVCAHEQPPLQPKMTMLKELRKEVENNPVRGAPAAGARGLMMRRPLSAQTKRSTFA